MTGKPVIVDAVTSRRSVQTAAARNAEAPAGETPPAACLVRTPHDLLLPAADRVAANADAIDAAPRRVNAPPA